jgi:periplasmic divalent cation tolerance protein
VNFIAGLEDNSNISRRELLEFFFMTDKIVVLSTCSSAEEAERIARRLVDLRLAGCVNVLAGVRSFYRWKDAIEDSGEWLLIVKTSRACLAKLRAELEQLHSYEVPEVVALPIVDGAPNYLNWLDAEIHE